MMLPPPYLCSPRRWRARREPPAPLHQGAMVPRPFLPPLAGSRQLSPYAASAQDPFLFPFTTKETQGHGGERGGKCASLSRAAMLAPRSAPTTAFVIPQLGLFGLDFC